MFKPLVFFCFFLVVFHFSRAENENSTAEKNMVLFEKVYLHIDRELYSPGDIIWFKSYLVSGINHQLIPGYKNIYVQLIASNGSVADQKLLLSDYGTARGDFLIPSSLPDGEYLIRAYTRYLENFGEESFFYKKIMVSRAKSSVELQNFNTKDDSSAIDISFLPEGGTLVLNTVNHIAFKAVDKKGKGIQVKGKVVDDSGNEVVPFQSRYKGMGKFVMMPQEGKNYFVVVDDHPKFNFSFEPGKPDGISMNYKPDGNYLIVTLSRNIKSNFIQEFKLVATHKGIELFRSTIAMQDFQHAFRLFKGLFPLGISKITLYDSHDRIVAERLVFIRNADDQKIRVSLAKKEYQTRENVHVQLSSLLPQNDTVLSTVSVSVVHEDYFSSSGNNQTIESFLLLDSDLKGSVESPASFFVDDADISSEEKLDLVMLVNGWRCYYWNDLEKYASMELPGWADIGLTLSGTVTRLWGGKPVDGGKVVLGPFSRNFLFEETVTNDSGSYIFDKLYLKDSALVMINAETKTGRKGTEITMNQDLSFLPGISPEQFQNFHPEMDVPMMFYRDIYYRKIAEEKYQAESGSILLGEITIEGERQKSDGHFRLYSEADHSFTITDDDWTYSSVLDYLEGRAPGVIVNGEEVRIRTSSRNPLLLIDGLTSDWDRIKDVSMGDIDKIEILKSGFASAVYGSGGGDGVIAIYTRMGKGEWEWESANDRYVRGRITPRVKGFEQHREFYSPKYTLENLNDPRPDSRPTLYWNPEVKFTENEAGFDFFTADKLARYNIIVEGISKNGKILLGTSLLTVTIPR
ncbi:MAG: TonB-dependent receptor plug domain-containing protein [Mariniphaga sp.]|nr:TonB-dependent receptor plug domain-containing protein [Mariniphaga sp.]